MKFTTKQQKLADEYAELSDNKLIEKLVETASFKIKAREHADEYTVASWMAIERGLGEKVVASGKDANDETYKFGEIVIQIVRTKELDLNSDEVKHSGIDSIVKPRVAIKDIDEEIKDIEKILKELKAQRSAQIKLIETSATTLNTARPADRQFPFVESKAPAYKASWSQ